MIPLTLSRAVSYDYRSLCVVVRFSKIISSISWYIWITS